MNVTEVLSWIHNDIIMCVDNIVYIIDTGCESLVIIVVYFLILSTSIIPSKCNLIACMSHCYIDYTIIFNIFQTFIYTIPTYTYHRSTIRCYYLSNIRTEPAQTEKHAPVKREKIS